MIRLGKLWHTQGTVHVCGYLQHPTQGFLEAASLAEYFSRITDEAALASELSKANGCFALVVENANGILAAVDRLRSIPLFWDQSGNLADKSEALAHLNLKSLASPEILSEFLMAGFVTGSDTLHKELKQIPAGHYLALNHGQSPQLKCYYRFLHNASSSQSVEDWIEQQHTLLLQVARDTLNSLNERPVVIPLSGGYDSRLLAYLFKTLKYPRIYTYSYDSRRHAESRISQRVAEHLALPWHFIDHSHRSWYQAFQSQARRDFYAFIVNASSSAHVQDWLAVQELQKRKLIPSDSVFIPGHSADFLEGSHLPGIYATQKVFSPAELQQQIISFHYRLWPNPSYRELEAFRARIQSHIQVPESLDASQAASSFEYWDLQERQAKFIVNSLRVYESLGYQWRMPFWDARLMDFWAAVPLQLRLNRKLWLLFAQKHLPIPIPVYKHPPFCTRALDKLLRIAFGELCNVRYGRFAEYRNPLYFARQKVANYMRTDLDYPSFINGNRALIRCDLNALQALIAIYELDS